MKFSISPVLLASAAIQIACQLFKVVFYSCRERKFQGGYFFSAGGVPSAHSAFVSSLSLGIGLRSGFGSDLFALSFVFTAIVIYDAFRLRGAVEAHAKLLNRLVLAYHPEEAGSRRLNERLGHTRGEILWGILAGCGGMFLFRGLGWV